jgi:DNA-binding FadR family transcriptional regulator
MKPVERARVLDQVIRSLVIELQSGAWSERVPGSRSLASTLKVSQPTVAEALKRLAEQGLLTGGGERRAYQVKNSAG